MKKLFVATYYSKGNLFEGELAIFARDLAEAQDKFFSWLKKNQVYTHLWSLTVTFQEKDEVLE